MEVLYKLHEALIRGRGSSGGGGGGGSYQQIAARGEQTNLQRVKEIRAKARATMVYAGSLRCELCEVLFCSCHVKDDRGKWRPKEERDFEVTDKPVLSLPHAVIRAIGVVRIEQSVFAQLTRLDVFIH